MKKYRIIYKNICDGKRHSFVGLTIDQLLLKIELLLMEDCCDKDSIAIDTNQTPTL
jgi:hypothetical protein